MKFLLAVICSAIVVAVAPSYAQLYPQRPITIVVAYPPGGATDVVARIVSDHLQSSLGQPVIVENMGGANGSVGTSRVPLPMDTHSSLEIGIISSPMVRYTILNMI